MIRKTKGQYMEWIRCDSRPRESGAFRGVTIPGLVILYLLGLPHVAAAEPFEMVDGDRIVFVGSTFIERDVRYGCIETLMTVHLHNLELTFRNLGWSGDNVFGIARASFDSVAKGYERLIAQVNEAKPSVVFMSYGQNESFKGEAGLDEFVAGYRKLLDDLASTHARFVLISPTLQENMGRPLPDPSAHNADVRLYTRAIAAIAEERDFLFIDLTHGLPVSSAVTTSPRTDNGLHFTEDGYWEAAAAIIKGLGYTSAKPTREELDPIRELINEKNRLFFLKWRPQNSTYITGFRKHEQGKHVAEFPQFDPLVAEEEAKIATLRRRLSKKGTLSQ